MAPNTKRRVTRAHILAAAYEWLDTPYQHQASVRGAGADCLGLVRGVWRDVMGPEPEPTPPYTPDWGEASSDEPLLAAAERWLRPLALAEAQPGDVVAFRMRPGACVKHLALVSGSRRILHAYWGRAVTETALTPWWRSRRAAAFAFPLETL